MQHYRTLYTVDKQESVLAGWIDTLSGMTSLKLSGGAEVTVTVVI